MEQFWFLKSWGSEVSEHAERAAKYTVWTVIYRKWTWVSHGSLKLCDGGWNQLWSFGWSELLGSLSELRICICMCFSGLNCPAAAPLSDRKIHRWVRWHCLLANLVRLPSPGSVYPDSPGAAGAHTVWRDREPPAGAPQHPEHAQTEELRQWINLNGGGVWCRQLVFNHKAKGGSVWKRSSVWDI